jgi:hypothetical protein
MAKTLNPNWVTSQKQLMANVAVGEPYSAVESFALAKTFIVTELTRRNIPFKTYNLGAGVMRITTDTDTCPCCKRKL